MELSDEEWAGILGVIGSGAVLYGGYKYIQRLLNINRLRDRVRGDVENPQPPECNQAVPLENIQPVLHENVLAPPAAAIAAVVEEEEISSDFQSSSLQFSSYQSTHSETSQAAMQSIAELFEMVKRIVGINEPLYRQYPDWDIPLPSSMDASTIASDPPSADSNLYLAVLYPTPVQSRAGSSLQLLMSPIHRASSLSSSMRPPTAGSQISSSSSGKRRQGTSFGISSITTDSESGTDFRIEPRVIEVVRSDNESSSLEMANLSLGNLPPGTSTEQSKKEGNVQVIAQVHQEASSSSSIHVHSSISPGEFNLESSSGTSTGKAMRTMACIPNIPTDSTSADLQSSSSAIAQESSSSGISTENTQGTNAGIASISIDTEITTVEVLTVNPAQGTNAGIANITSPGTLTDPKKEERTSSNQTHDEQSAEQSEDDTPPLDDVAL